jgi:hypothetical protein
MKRTAFLLVALLTVAGIVAPSTPASGRDDGEAAPIFEIKIFPAYRDWRLISAAHEEGSLNDLRASFSISFVRSRSTRSLRSEAVFD